MIQYKYKNILNIIVFKIIILVYIMLTNLIQIKYSILYDLKKLKLDLSYYVKQSYLMYVVVLYLFDNSHKPIIFYF